MQFWLAIFITSCGIVFYNYAGYAIIAYAINRLKKKKEKKADFFPGVSFIVAAFNEEDMIEKKVLNSLEQNYPGEKIEYIFITDGSSDKTPEIIKRHTKIRLLHQPDRKGKSAAVNRAVEASANEILIFSDANTMLNKDAVLNIVRHYQDKKTGGVAGEKKVISSPAASGEMVTTEGVYWKYESFLKKIDSDFYSVVGAAGELFSVRKELYQPVAHNVILDDFIISLKVAQQGYRIIYEPQAYAMEQPSFSLKDEQKRKVRIAAGGFQSIVMLAGLFKFWKHARLSFLYISHRVLRWTLSPLCLILAFVSNMILFFQSNNIFIKGFFVAQVLFYLVACIAFFLPANSKLKIFKVPYYFMFMNVSVILGFIRFLRGKQSAVWDKAKRAETNVVTQ